MITKAGIFSWKTKKKLESSKKIYKDSKRNHKKTVQQEKVKSTRTKRRKQYVAKS